MDKNSNESKVERAKDSEAFRKAKSKAEEYAQNPEKLNDLIDKASKKAKRKRGPLDTVWIQLMACFRLIKAYAKGTYRETPWASLVILIAAVIYFVMPFDLVPDFIFVFGILDDAALIGWVVNSFRSDIEAFLNWEMNNDA